MIFETPQSRRDFLKLALKAGAGCAAVSCGLRGAGSLFAAEAPGAAGLSEAEYYEKLPGGQVRCTLCPRELIIAPGKICVCKTRKNIGGTLYAMGAAKTCIVNFDPVERGPLYHFIPGTESMTLGAAGCNLNCLYCQNYELAQTTPEKAPVIKLDTERAVRESRIKSITLTYTEPAVQPEYVRETAKTARKFSLPLIICTGAYINERPLKDMLPLADAFVVTLKAATEDSYVKLTEARMKPVLDAIKTIKNSGKWLEIITLLVPGYNDTKKDVEFLAAWMKDNTGAETPWHFSRFTPNYMLKKTPPTPRRTMEEARDLALAAGLKFVYLTNIAPHEGNNTYCPSCGKKIIERLAFKTNKISMKDGGCAFCGTKIPGVWSLKTA
jgi:pyruvate formate lyase activating enzyme